MADIEIEIDGKKLTAKPNQMVIQVADEAGIYIPRFCYHKHLSIAANCRMCLVEVEKSPKALPACATPVSPGMKVFTQSQKTIAAQRAVMEFLLINHPLDCPICDQGGECELQDLSMGYGASASHYDECKRAVADQDIGPLIATDMTRCILCTRCVRFGAEIAGMREIGVTFRGEHAEISTYVQHAIRSEVSGNIIDICPVGALTSKPYRFTARAWELEQAPSISPHDCIGSNLFVHTLYGKVMRVVSRENPMINETWLSDRDRFSYTGLYHEDRLQAPMARINGEWQTVEWQQAFELIVAGLQKVLIESGVESLGALASPNSTLEEFYLLQKLVRGLGCPNIDHRLREVDTSDDDSMPVAPGLGMTMPELEQHDAFLLIGANVRKEQPLAALRIRKATQAGAVVMAVNACDDDFNFPVASKKIVAPHHYQATLAGILKALCEQTGSKLPDNLDVTLKDVAPDETLQAIAKQLRTQKPCILLGELASHHPQAAAIRYLAQKIAALSQAQLGLLTAGANTAGGWLAGAVPHRGAGGVTASQHGLSAYKMLAQPRQAYLLLNVEPDKDCANAQLAMKALQQAKFVVALSMYRNPVLDACANVILPIAPFTETSGTFVNGAFAWQSFHGVAQPVGSSRPAWKVLRVLGNFLHLDGFNYESAEEVKHEVTALTENMPAFAMQTKRPESLDVVPSSDTLTRIGEVPIYAGDSMVRRAQPLQAAQTIMLGDTHVARIHPQTAKKMNVQDGDHVQIKQQQAAVRLPVKLDDRIAQDAVWVAGGVTVSTELGDLFGEISMEKV